MALVTPLWAADPVTWIDVDYGALLNRGAVVRTGQSLGSALRELKHQASARGAVQPYLDPYVFVLEDAVHMLHGPDAVPYRNLAENYPAGSVQPAWAALLRGGRYFISTDEQGGVRMFLPGDHSKQAYQQHYPSIRHALALLAQAAGKLKISVYAYRHDYADATYHLHPAPYVFEASVFRTPEGRIPLDLELLDRTLKKGEICEGLVLDTGSDPVAITQAGSHAMLAGEPLGLSDFAVAYRAVFHAGDNQAFISLDPHEDPTKVKVNFGGYLEDTHLGSAVLEADKRFKTLTIGLDPDTHENLGVRTRQILPDFLSSAESDLIHGRSTGSQWVGTRLWFYPESVEVDTDTAYHYAQVTRPQLSADAERSRDDFATPADFEKFKKTRLSPSIRTVIDHLNTHYAGYAAAFDEFAELRDAARLMGLCAWLKKAGAAGPRTPWDWDALLSVDLPAFRTPRDNTKMMAVAWLVYPEQLQDNEVELRNRVQVQYLAAALDETLAVYFETPQVLAAFLAQQRFGSKDRASELLDEAAELLAQHPDRKLRRLIGSNQALQTLAIDLSERVQKPISEDMQGTIRTAWVTEIGGGIELSPEQFRIKAVKEPSFVKDYAARVQALKPTFKQQIKTLIPALTVPKLKPKPPEVWKSQPAIQKPAGRILPLEKSKEKYWKQNVPASASWKDRLQHESGLVREQHFDAASKRLTVQEKRPGETVAYTAQLQSPTRIVFEKPKTPPVSDEPWWQ